ncbi:DUF5300 family protein [Agathobacter sp.]|uniref:DUF5300 family protein n=1 Tax=Agathobacter sp. TaxID=2021311 RepID=UPI003FD6E190
MIKSIKKHLFVCCAVVCVLLVGAVGCISVNAAQVDDKKSSTIELVNVTYLNLKNIKVTYNTGDEQAVASLNARSSVDLKADTASVYEVSVTGETVSGQQFSGSFRGLISGDARIYVNMDDDADICVSTNFEDYE